MYWFVILQVPCICKWWPSSANISHWYLRTTLQTARWPAESAPFEYAIPSLSTFHLGGDRVWVRGRPLATPGFRKDNLGSLEVTWILGKPPCLCVTLWNRRSCVVIREKAEVVSSWKRINNKCIIGIQTGPGTFSWFILFFCICTVMLFNHCSHC